MGNRSMFVGLDVHKETIDVSIAEGHRDGEVRHYGVIASDLEPLDKVVRALRAPDRQLHAPEDADRVFFVGPDSVRCFEVPVGFRRELRECDLFVGGSHARLQRSNRRRVFG